MENDSRAGDDSQQDDALPMTTAAARDALAGLGTDSASLAARVVTPLWYHPILGLIVAAFTFAQAVRGPWSMIVLAIGAAVLALLVIVYRQRYGVWVSQPPGRRSRRAIWAVVALYITLFAAATAVQLWHLPQWWALIPAGIAFVLTIVLGRRYDAALRRDIAQQGGQA